MTTRKRSSPPQAPFVEVVDDEDEDEDEDDFYTEDVADGMDIQKLKLASQMAMHAAAFATLGWGLYKLTQKDNKPLPEQPTPKRRLPKGKT